MTASTDLFKFRQFPPDVILWAVRWYLRYTLTYRDLEEMMAELDVGGGRPLPVLLQVIGLYGEFPGDVFDNWQGKF